MSLLQSFQSNLDIVQLSFNALEYLSYDDGNKIRILDYRASKTWQNGFEIMISLMNKWRKNPIVLECACKAIWSITTSVSLPPKTLTSANYSEYFNKSNDNESDNLVLSSEYDEEFYHSSNHSNHHKFNENQKSINKSNDSNYIHPITDTTALDSVDHIERNLIRIREAFYLAGICEILIFIMKHYSKSAPSLIEIACGTLSVVSTGNSKICIQIGSLGGCFHLLNLINIYMSNKSVLINCCQIILNLVKINDQDMICVLIGLGAVEQLTKISSLYHQDSNMIEIILNIIHHLSGYCTIDKYNPGIID